MPYAMGGQGASGRLLEPLIAEYTAIFGSTWRPATRRKHRDDFARLVEWLDEHDRPVTLDSFDFATLVAFVDDLRNRPKVSGVWRGDLAAAARSRAAGHGQTLSANSVNTYVRPLRSLAIWLVEEGIIASNPFGRSRRRRGLNPLLPSEETPTKGSSIADLAALERGCAGDTPLDLRDLAIVTLLKTTAARNSSVRLLRIGEIDFARRLVRFRRAKGGKTLEVALHPQAEATLRQYLEHGRPRLTGAADRSMDADGFLFLSHRGEHPLSMNALSLMLTRRYRVGGGSLPYFGSHRIRHGVATLMVNNGMPLDEVSRYLGHSSTAPTRRYAVHTPDALGHRAAEAMARAGLVPA